MRNGSDACMTFATWKEEVDKLFFLEFGAGSDDFADYLWRDAYDDGFSPREAFKNWKIDCMALSPL